MNNKQMNETMKIAKKKQTLLQGSFSRQNGLARPNADQFYFTTQKKETLGTRTMNCVVDLLE